MSDNQIKRFALLSVGIYAALRIAERVQRGLDAIGSKRYSEGFFNGQRHAQFFASMNPLPPAQRPEDTLYVGPEPAPAPAPHSAEREL